MKEGRTLVALATELDRQLETKEDYIVDTRSLALELVQTSGGPAIADTRMEPRLDIKQDGDFGSLGYPILTHAHRQIGERVKIPAKYYDRMLQEAPELLCTNVNHWFQTVPEKRMVRVMDVDGCGEAEVRAFLSNRYRRLDNFDLMQVVIPILQSKEADGLRIESCEVTHSRIYIKAVTAKITAQVDVGDIVQAGICISNSEIGMGAVKVEPLVYIMRCSNGMIAADHGMSQYHLGRALGGGDDSEGARRMFKDDTIRAADEAFWRKVRDVVDGSLDQDVFGRIVDEMRAAKQVPVERPIEAVEQLAQRQSFSDTEKESTLRHLVESGDTSLYGLSNAVTRMSQDVASYDRATELEHLGHQVLSLNPADLRGPQAN